MAGQFPVFADGDLQVVLPGGRNYQLHAGVFRRASDEFSDILSENREPTLGAKAKKGVSLIRYRLDLVGVESGQAKFVRRKLDSMGRCSLFNTLPDIENGKVPNEVYKHYDNVFRSFYHEVLDLDTKELATVLHDCMGLVNVAEKHRCVSAVRESVDIALLRHGQILFRSIAQNPTAWAHFAYRIQSPSIFKDSLIHMVGKWKMLSEDDHIALDPDIVRICQRKHAEFQLQKEAVELRILGHYSPNIQKAESDNPGRISYANDVYSWMGLSLFRQWFAQNICQGNNFQARDGGYGFYYLLSKGGTAYLDRVQLEGFHLYFPMTAKGKTVLNNHMNAYKAEIKAFVAPLMLNHTQLEIQDQKRPSHLICLEVDERDYPWNNLDEQSDTGN